MSFTWTSTGTAKGPRSHTPGLAFARVLSSAQRCPYDEVQWVRRDLRLVKPATSLAPADLRDVEMPADWTAEAALAFLAQNLAVGAPAEEAGESASVRRVLEQICGALAEQGRRAGCFSSQEDAEIFRDELAALMLRQMAALRLAPPAHSAAEHRRPRQRLMTLGTEDLIAKLDRCAPAMEGSPACVLTLRNDEMAAMNNDSERADTAREQLSRIAAITRSNGGPEFRFAGAMRRWSAPVEERPGFAVPGSAVSADADVASPNPDDVGQMPAATLNIAPFLTSLGALHLPQLQHAVAVLITALDIGIGGAWHGQSLRGAERRSLAASQVAAIADGRPVSLGFTNLGALLMECGLPYDDARSRSLSAALAAFLCGEAFAHSARMAETCPQLTRQNRSREESAAAGTGAWGGGACDAFRRAPEASLALLRRRRGAAVAIAANAGGELREDDQRASRHGGQSRLMPQLLQAAIDAWDRALCLGELFGLRNLEVTAVVDDGALATVLDSTTVSLEPVLSLVHAERKTVSGEPAGWRPRRVVGATLFRMGYSYTQVGEVLATLEQTGSLAASAAVREEHRALFLPPRRAAQAMLRLFAAMQPFVSTAQPLRVTLPEEISTAEVAALVRESWQLGVATVQFRLGERRPSAPIRPQLAEKSEHGMGWVHDDRDPATSWRRPTSGRIESIELRSAVRGESPLERDHAALLEVQISDGAEPVSEALAVEAPRASIPEQHHASERRALPAERASVTHAFSIGGQQGRITVGLYPNGAPGEVFVRMSNADTAVSAMLEVLSTATSFALQHGVSLHTFAERLSALHFEPCGGTANPRIPYARSVVDYLFRWLAMRFVPNPAVTRAYPDGSL